MISAVAFFSPRLAYLTASSNRIPVLLSTQLLCSLATLCSTSIAISVSADASGFAFRASAIADVSSAVDGGACLTSCTGRRGRVATGAGWFAFEFVVAATTGAEAACARG